MLRCRALRRADVGAAYSAASAVEQHRRKKGGAFRHGLGQDVFARRMRAVADRTEAIQRRNVKSCGEIAVRAAPGDAFANLQTHLSRQRSRALIKRGAVLTLEGGAAEASVNFQSCTRRNWFESA
jgi:hypothetical protein